jgi:hypothetical protein
VRIKNHLTGAAHRGLTTHIMMFTNKIFNTFNIFTSVKKITAILLLSVYLFSATDAKELLKMNVVFDHFTETRATDKAVSFLHFLVMHYVTDDHNDKDNNRDMQLPFKSPDTCIANNSLVSLHNQFASFTFNFFPVNERDFIIAEKTFVISNYQALVWHPPQFS